MENFDALITRGDNPQTMVIESDSPDHPFNRPFEERYDWILLCEQRSEKHCQEMLRIEIDRITK